jgi:hypothetical protein
MMNERVGFHQASSIQQFIITAAAGSKNRRARPQISPFEQLFLALFNG